MNEHLSFNKGTISISKHDFDGICWLLFSDFTDSIQIYANKSQINAFENDLRNWRSLRSQELFCSSGSIFMRQKDGGVNIIVYGENNNISEIFIQLAKDEIKEFSSLLKKSLDNWD